MMAMATVSIPVELDEGLKISLDRAVESGAGDSDAIISEALRVHLETISENGRIIDERLHRIRSGKAKWINEDTMMTWFDSLGTNNKLPKPNPQ